MLLAGCITTKPRQCEQPAPRFDTAIYTATGSFWFSHALVTRGYHGSGIAAEEVLSDPSYRGLVFHMSVRPAADCTISERTWRVDRPVSFRRISGRATFDQKTMTVVVDCICTVEPTDYADPHGRFTTFR